LAWSPCGTAAGVQCATAGLSLDYEEPTGEQVHIAVAGVPARDTAHRIGSLFVDLGGHGAESVSYLQAAGAGVFAALCPDRYRALVLDGPVDAEAYLHHPIGYVADQTASFESSLGRFLAGCDADQTACSGFGGATPSVAYDNLIAPAGTTPSPAAGYRPDPRPVGADEIRLATLPLLYAKRLWGLLGLVLARAAGGDAGLVRAPVDEFYGRRAEGALHLVRELGNVRLLTMDGADHAAYGTNSTCVNTAAEACLVGGTLPPQGTVCRQEVPFAPAPPLPAGAAAAVVAWPATGVGVACRSARRDERRADGPRRRRRCAGHRPRRRLVDWWLSA
jgi:hypothetical protein